MNTDHEQLQEILQRVTRLESRLVQLGDYVGANLRTKQRITLQSDRFGNCTRIDIDAIDVSLSRIVAELERNKVDATALGIWLDGRLVATLYPLPLGCGTVVPSSTPTERIK